MVIKFGKDVVMILDSPVPFMGEFFIGDKDQYPEIVTVGGIEHHLEKISKKNGMAKYSVSVNGFKLITNNFENYKVMFGKVEIGKTRREYLKQVVKFLEKFDKPFVNVNNFPHRFVIENDQASFTTVYKNTVSKFFIPVWKNIEKINLDELEKEIIKTFNIEFKPSVVIPRGTFAFAVYDEKYGYITIHNCSDLPLFLGKEVNMSLPRTTEIDFTVPNPLNAPNKLIIKKKGIVGNALVGRRRGYTYYVSESGFMIFDNVPESPELFKIFMEAYRIITMGVNPYSSKKVGLIYTKGSFQAFSVPDTSEHMVVKVNGQKIELPTVKHIGKTAFIKVDDKMWKSVNTNLIIKSGGGSISFDGKMMELPIEKDVIPTRLVMKILKGKKIYPGDFIEGLPKNSAFTMGPGLINYRLELNVPEKPKLSTPFSMGAHLWTTFAVYGTGIYIVETEPGGSFGFFNDKPPKGVTAKKLFDFEKLEIRELKDEWTIRIDKARTWDSVENHFIEGSIYVTIETDAGDVIIKSNDLEQVEVWRNGASKHVESEFLAALNGDVEMFIHVVLDLS